MMITLARRNRLQSKEESANTKDLKVRTTCGRYRARPAFERRMRWDSLKLYICIVTEMQTIANALDAKLVVLTISFKQLANINQ